MFKTSPCVIFIVEVLKIEDREEILGNLGFVTSILSSFRQDLKEQTLETFSKTVPDEGQGAHRTPPTLSLPAAEAQGVVGLSLPGPSWPSEKNCMQLMQISSSMCAYINQGILYPHNSVHVFQASQLEITVMEMNHPHLDNHLTLLSSLCGLRQPPSSPAEQAVVTYLPGTLTLPEGASLLCY